MQPDPTADLIAARGRTHGDFTDHARATQRLKTELETFVCAGHGEPAWTSLTQAQQESLHMIAHKIGRILAGDPDFRDHWLDISGYARLVAERCSK
jgi:hypothetical protein